jgi:hypothetical protein
MTKTIKQQSQDMSGREHIAAERARNVERAKKKKQEQKLCYARVSDDKTVKLTGKANCLLAEQSTFNVGRHESLLQIFLRMVPEQLILQMIDHSYTNWFDRDDPTLFTVRDCYKYLAGKLRAMYLQCTEGASQKEALRRLNRDQKGAYHGYNKQVWFNQHFYIPHQLCEATVSDLLTQMVTVQGVFCIDEKKIEYHGHCEHIIMNKQKPCLWQVQACVSVKGSILPFVVKLRSLTGGDQSKQHLLKQMTKDIPAKAVLVFDSYYTTRGVLTKTGGRWLPILRVNQGWHVQVGASHAVSRIDRRGRRRRAHRRANACR